MPSAATLKKLAEKKAAKGKMSKSTVSTLGSEQLVGGVECLGIGKWLRGVKVARQGEARGSH